MQESTRLMQDITVRPSHNSVLWKVLLATLLGSIGIAASTKISDLILTQISSSVLLAGIIQAGTTSILVLAIVWLLRSVIDRKSISSLGVDLSLRSLIFFMFGTGLVLVPFVVIFVTTNFFGWATLTLNYSAFASGMLIAFLLEALPEELLVRGYIYRTANTVMPRWRASLVQLIVFVLMPFIIQIITRTLFNIQIGFNSGDTFNISFVIVLIMFGAFVQLLRLLTDNIWAGVAFHVFFLQVNRMRDFIEFSDMNPNAPIQWVALGIVGITAICLAIYTWQSWESIGWNDIDPE